MAACRAKLLGVIGPGPALQHQALALDDDPEIIDPPTQPPVDLRLDLLDDPGATALAALIGSVGDSCPMALTIATAGGLAVATGLDARFHLG